VTTLPNEKIIVTWDELVMRDSVSSRKIGVQVIGENGRMESRRFITPDSAVSSYPVVSVTGEDRFIVAYTVKAGDTSYIKYQPLPIGN
jgi:hypothetical protein